MYLSDTIEDVLGIIAQYSPLSVEVVPASRLEEDLGLRASDISNILMEIIDRKLFDILLMEPLRQEELDFAVVQDMIDFVIALKT